MKAQIVRTPVLFWTETPLVFELFHSPNTNNWTTSTKTQTESSVGEGSNEMRIARFFFGRFEALSPPF